MVSFKNDQAAGLRRIMAAPKPRVVSIISASSADQSRMMINLAASIRAQGSDVLIVHASKTTREASYEIDKTPALLEVAKTSTSLSVAIKNTKQEFAVAKLLPKNQVSTPLNSDAGQVLNQLFDELVLQYEIVLVDATLNNDDLLPLKTLNDSDILIQLTREPESIKDAYTLIKRICSQLGRRSFGIIVDDANEAQAEVVFNNIAQVAKRFMQIELEFFGAIPADVHLGKAAKLGRPVTDAFPLTPASNAFQQIAQRLNSKSTRTPNIDMLYSNSAMI
ncbi:MinD/ParA family ATP-binding protein [Methylotenera sp. L2L1]|uniref:MinD/ParA family ATP-binding protein n=1 Tax=Methylotenera sp. L2L1 TaxID=1502770 RepID=UPI00055E0819|nr:MotR [Methylotenera sp. L2L1]